MANRSVLWIAASSVAAASIMCIIRGWTPRHFAFGLIGALTYFAVKHIWIINKGAP